MVSERGLSVKRPATTPDAWLPAMEATRHREDQLPVITHTYIYNSHKLSVDRCKTLTIIHEIRTWVLAWKMAQGVNALTISLMI